MKRKGNYLIPKVKSFKIHFEGIEPIFNIVYKTSDRSTTHYERGLFFPLHRLMSKIKLRMEYYDFKKIGIEPIPCEGCGEGWARWLIDEPNGENYTIMCCNGCVDFYDWKMSRRILKPEIYKKVNKKKKK